MTEPGTLILGGGLAGLSCAYQLTKSNNENYLLLEGLNEAGGLARSIKQDGFVFDHTGHLLHLHKPGTLELIRDELGVELVPNQRNAWIYSHDTYTRYPFQANLHGLPIKVILECLWGLFRTQYFKSNRESDKLKKFRNGHIFSQHIPHLNNDPDKQDQRQLQTFRNWVEYTFGMGFANHFFFPYNRKLWTVEPEELTTEWMGQFVPKPSQWEIFKGAFVDQTKKFGYNATFYYPKEGGIQTLAKAFERKLNSAKIRLNTEVTSIDLDQKKIITRHGEIIVYDNLVTTLPLAKFLSIVKDSGLGSDLLNLKSRLKWTSVYNLNLGIRHLNPTRAETNRIHWIYFPEEDYEFYRVGFPMNFSGSMAPAGCSSMYIEFAHKPDQQIDDNWALEKAMEGLTRCKLYNPGDQILTKNILRIPVAYVIYDKHWEPARSGLLNFLKSRNVYSIGRFGGWKYSYMEAAILEGKATAEKILGN